MAKGNGVQRGASPPAKAQAKYGQERAVYCNIATKSLVGRSSKKTAEDSKTETRSGQCSAQIGQCNREKIPRWAPQCSSGQVRRQFKRYQTLSAGPTALSPQDGAAVYSHELPAMRASTQTLED